MGWDVHRLLELLLVAPRQLSHSIILPLGKTEVELNLEMSSNSGVLED